MLFKNPISEFFRKRKVEKVRKIVLETFAAIKEDIDCVLRERKEPDNLKNTKHYDLYYVLTKMSEEMGGEKMFLSDFGLSKKEAIKLLHDDKIATMIIFVERCKNGDSSWAWPYLENSLKPYSGSVALEEIGIFSEEINELCKKYEHDRIRNFYEYWCRLPKYYSGLIHPNISEYENKRSETAKSVAAFIRERKMSTERVRESLDRACYADRKFIESVKIYL